MYYNVGSSFKNSFSIAASLKQSTSKRIEEEKE